MPKYNTALRIDAPPIDTSSAAAAAGEYADLIDSPAPPALADVESPTGLELATLLSRSAGTPTALVNATWAPPLGYDASTIASTLSYMIQWSTDSTFATNVNGAAALQPSAAIDGLATGTTYYFRVAAVFRTVQSVYGTSASILTAVDTTPPNPVTSPAWSWGASGDLDITWTDPTSANLKAIEVKIWSDAGKTVFYRALTAAPAAGRTVYTAAMNAADTSNAYDPAVYIEIKALSWGGIYSTVATPASQPTKAVPTTPAGLTSSWASDTGIAGGDCVISWTKGADCMAYQLTIDGTARTVYGDRFTYTFDANRAEHSNTPDPVLTIGLVALDGLNQASASAALTATNATPATTSATLFGGYSTIGVAVTASAAADVRDYTIRIVKDGVTSATYTTTSLNQIYSATAAGSYQVGVKVNDLFGQASTETLSSAVIIDALTIAELRAEAIYSDDQANTTTALAALKDDIKGSGGISYPAPTYRDSTGTASTAAAGVTSLALTIPALTVAGDVMIAAWAFRGGSGVSLTTPPAGWTLIGRIDSGSSTSLVVYKKAWASGDTGPALVISSLQAMAGTITSVSGGDTSTIVDISASQANASSTNVGFASVTTTAGSALLLGLAAGAGSNTFTPDGTMTERQDVRSTNASSNVAMEISSQALAAAGATGTKTAVQSNTAVSVSYTIAIRPAWHWTLVQRSLLDRYITVTASAASGQGYVGVSADGSTYTWYSGPLGVDGRTLTAVASEAAAQAAAVALPLSSSAMRWELPTVQEARYIKLGHRPTTSGSYALYEYYPRRMVEGDDIRAESIKAINIAAASITADRMSVTQLSALTADMGAITAGTITGTTIQTATSGARIVLNSSGFTSYNSSNVAQVAISSSTGAFSAAAGAVLLDAAGLTFTGGTALVNAIKWYSGADLVGKVYTAVSSGVTTVEIAAFTASGGTSNTISLTSGFYGYTASSTGIHWVRIPSSGGVFKVLTGVGVGNTAVEFAANGSGANVTVHAGYVTAGQTSPAFTANNNPGSFQCDNWFRSYNSTGWLSETYGGGWYMTDSTYMRLYNAKMLLASNWIHSQAAIGINQIKSSESTTTGISMAMFSGEPGVAYTNGVLGYNYAAVNGGSTAREQSTGGAFIRMTTAGSMELHTITTAGADNYALGIGAAGNVGLAQKLYIGGTGVTPSYQIHLSTDSAGKPGTNTWTIVSDGRTKNDLGRYTEGLAILRQLRPIRFSYNGKANTPTDGREYVGLIAQEVEPVAPAMITKIAGEIDGQEAAILQLDSHNLTYMLLNAVCELASRVEQLEQRPNRRKAKAA